MKAENKLLNKSKILLISEFALFIALAFIFWFTNDYDLLHLIIFLYIGVFVTIGGFLYARLPGKIKHIGRRFSFISVSVLLFVTAIFLRENLQIEGLFLSLIAGLYSTTLLHYLVAKVIGPLIIGRAWCGWACWSMMIFDLLPYKQSSGRHSGGWIRYVHFLLSLGFVLFFFFRVSPTMSKNEWFFWGMRWFLIGNAIYYALGITLAMILKDNRAFCKYICPIAVFLKTFSIFSLLKIQADNKSSCRECNACTKACPMDIRIPDYTKGGRRVLSNECTMCLECIRVCPKNILKVSVGFDLGTKNILR